jgi:tetratricopeptide (TPR) repeat protein
MVGFTVAEILPGRTVELLPLFVSPEYRRAGIGTLLVRQLQQDLTIQLGTEVNLIDRQKSVIQPPQAPARDMFARGKQEYRQGNSSVAQACFEAAIQLQPDFIPAYNSLRNLLQVRGKISQAIDIYQQDLKLDPQVAAIHCNLASFYQLQGDRDLAITGYQRSLDLDPDFWLSSSTVVISLAFFPMV